MTKSSHDIWNEIRTSAARLIEAEPTLEPLAYHLILANDTMAVGLARLLSHQHIDTHVKPEDLTNLFQTVFENHPEILEVVAADLEAVINGDPAATDYLVPFIYFKGFHALQTYRVAHVLWQEERKHMALFLQSRSSLLYGVDIHPAATIGKAIMFDHATGIVIGETAVVEDYVSIFHGATLGGRGTERGDRHPKIRQGVMIGAGATILGNVEVGKNTTVAACSVVLKDVPAYTTVAGVPARAVSV